MLDLPIQSLSFTAFDFETTGLSPDRDRIIEIGAVRITGGEIGETFHTLVNPGMPIPPDATAIHGLGDDHVRTSPAIEAVLPAFMAFLAGTVAFAHNAGFDLGFLSCSLDRSGLPRFPGPVVDTIPLAKRAFPGRVSYSLQNLAAWLGLTVTKAHGALEDAKLCAELFQVCMFQFAAGPSLTLRELGCHLPENADGVRFSRRGRRF